MKKNKWMKWLLYFFAIVGALTIVDESSGLLDSLFPLIILAFIIYGIKRWWDKRQQAKTSGCLSEHASVTSRFNSTLS